MAGADVYQWSWVGFVGIVPSLNRRIRPPPIRMSMFGSPVPAFADLYENAHARLWVNTSTAITAPALVGQINRPSLYARWHGCMRRCASIDSLFWADPSGCRHTNSGPSSLG